MHRIRFHIEYWHLREIVSTDSDVVVFVFQDSGVFWIDWNGERNS